MSALKSITDTAHYLDIGRSSIYRLLGTGKLKSVKIGRRNLITVASIEQLLAASNDT